MAISVFRTLRRASSLLSSSPSLYPFSLRSIKEGQEPIFCPPRQLVPLNPMNPSWVYRSFSHGRVKLVISEGNPKFETQEVDDPPSKDKWQTKKKLKMQRKRKKQKRKAANKKNPCNLTVKRKRKQKFANAEERIKSKLERARIKEASLIERLKRYEVPKVQGPEVKPHDLTGEERFFLKKMSQKRSNYVPIGRRGVFGGVILNMHMHWKKHETVKVICNQCKPGQLCEIGEDIARLSGGIPINTIGDDTIVFYRGKDYVQPEVMSPIDTLSKKRALEKSKYEQSLEDVRHFIAAAEKELELYYRHIALYGDPNHRNPLSILDGPKKDSIESEKLKRGSHNLSYYSFSPSVSETEADSSDQELSSHVEGGNFSSSESDSEDDNLYNSDDEEKEESGSSLKEMSSSKVVPGSLSKFGYKLDTERQ